MRRFRLWFVSAWRGAVCQSFVAVQVRQAETAAGLIKGGFFSTTRSEDIRNHRRQRECLTRYGNIAGKPTAGPVTANESERTTHPLDHVLVNKSSEFNPVRGDAQTKCIDDPYHEYKTLSMLTLMLGARLRLMTATMQAAEDAAAKMHAIFDRE